MIFYLLFVHFLVNCIKDQGDAGRVTFWSLLAQWGKFQKGIRETEKWVSIFKNTVFHVLA